MTQLEVIRPFVEQAVKEFLGVDQLKVMKDGTIPILSGSAAVHVRLVQLGGEERPLLQVFCPLLSGVERSPELMDKLNDMNAGFSFARVFWESGQVIIAMELLAEELDKEQVAHACRLVTFASDYWDDELQRGFGGATSVPDGEGTSFTEAPDPDQPSSTEPGEGGYL
ncbi:MAG: hypothetical protein QOE83_115 [Actinomycetota bacterium]|nr:hypothetical protein [Actinomycetota bacterium]